MSETGSSWRRYADAAKNRLSKWPQRNAIEESSREASHSDDKSKDLEAQYKVLNSSGYFDAEYYLKANPDVARSGMDPLMHFLMFGGMEGRNPSTTFDSRYYLSRNADVRETDANPLLHYITTGKSQGRSTHPKTHVVPKRSKRATSKRIDIINVNFYDWDGEILYKGGAERYVFDLARILTDMGHKARILQNATTEFTKHYRGIEVVGVVTGATDATGPSLRTMSQAFNQFCNNADLIIASPIDLACEIDATKVLGINHGIHWDHKNKRLYNNRTSSYQEIFDALDNITTGVCVDTNFINWTRTYDYSFGEKLTYVPNYYDQTDFVSSKKSFDNRLRIMYPRRLYEARGITITIEAFTDLLARYKNVDLLLVGQTNDPNVIKAVNRLMRKFPKQVTLEEYDMQDMAKAYKKSHVVLIPTLYAEGTSLSAIEAMATNNAVIATNIGGLPNLVIDGYNGHLIDPTTQALKEAVEKLIKDRTAAERLARNALDVVQVFEKQLWDERWRKILKEVL